MSAINDVFKEYLNKQVQLNIRVLEDEVVLVQGNKESLKLLGTLLLTLAESDEEKIQISPRGAGSTFFDKGSKLGIYINKI
jgi:hypothetical protein